MKVTLFVYLFLPPTYFRTVDNRRLFQRNHANRCSFSTAFYDWDVVIEALSKMEGSQIRVFLNYFQFLNNTSTFSSLHASLGKSDRLAYFSNGQANLLFELDKWKCFWMNKFVKKLKGYSIFHNVFLWRTSLFIFLICPVFLRSLRSLFERHGNIFYFK